MLQRLHAWAAIAWVVALIVQVFLAGQAIANLGGSGDFSTHISVGYTIGIIQLVVSGRSDDPCRSLTHYVLRGCREDPTCDVPEWDFTMAPPRWWQCSAPASACC